MSLKFITINNEENGMPHVLVINSISGKRVGVFYHNATVEEYVFSIDKATAFSNKAMNEISIMLNYINCNDPEDVWDFEEGIEEDIDDSDEEENILLEIDNLADKIEELIDLYNDLVERVSTHNS